MFKKHIAAVVLLVSIAWADSCLGNDDIADLQRKKYLVRSVTDGDTIKLSNGMKVRYIGIDTPETMKRIGGEWEHSPEPYGPEAKEYNKTLVSGKKVTLEFDIEKKDRYGRYLAYVYVDDVMVNLELLKKGYARVYIFPPNAKYLDLFLKTQKEARRDKLGLWSVSEQK